MRALQLVCCAALYSAISGCAGLQVDVDHYKGELSHSYRKRLADARGRANAAYTLLLTNEHLKKYFATIDESAGDPKGAKPRTPKRYIEQINSVFQDAELGGIPRPKDHPSNDQENDAIDAKLNLLEKELREFGSYLENLQAAAIIDLNANESDWLSAIRTLDTLAHMGREIQDLTEFPDFGEVVQEQHEWVRLNPIHDYSAFGRSALVFYLDETGNYQIKTSTFDPSDVARVASKMTGLVLKTVMSAYGIPLPVSTSTPSRPSVANLDVETDLIRNRLQSTVRENKFFIERLQDLEIRIQRAEATWDKATSDVYIEKILREIEMHEKRVEAIQGGK